MSGLSILKNFIQPGFIQQSNRFLLMTKKFFTLHIAQKPRQRRAGHAEKFELLLCPLKFNGMVPVADLCKK